MKNMWWKGSTNRAIYGQVSRLAKSTPSYLGDQTPRQQELTTIHPVKSTKKPT